jgi:hypothetical protein
MVIVSLDLYTQSTPTKEQQMPDQFLLSEPTPVHLDTPEPFACDEAADVEARLHAMTENRDRLQARVTELEQVRESLLINPPRPRVEDDSELAQYISRAVRVNAPDADVSIENGEDDDIIVTISNAVLDEDGRITVPTRSFDVEFTVTVRGSFTVKAQSEGDADDIVREAVDNFRYDVEACDFPEGDDIEDVQFSAESDYSVTEPWF